MAERAGMAVTPHVSGGFTSYNALLFCSVIPNAGHYHEYKGFGELGDYVNGGLAIKDGRVRIPGGPGAWNRRRIAEAPGYGDGI